MFEAEPPPIDINSQGAIPGAPTAQEQQILDSLLGPQDGALPGSPLDGQPAAQGFDPNATGIDSELIAIASQLRDQYGGIEGMNRQLRSTQIETAKAEAKAKVDAMFSPQHAGLKALLDEGIIDESDFRAREQMLLASYQFSLDSAQQAAEMKPMFDDWQQSEQQKQADAKVKGQVDQIAKAYPVLGNPNVRTLLEGQLRAGYSPAQAAQAVLAVTANGAATRGFIPAPSQVPVGLPAQASTYGTRGAELPDPSTAEGRAALERLTAQLKAQSQRRG